MKLNPLVKLGAAITAGALLLTGCSGGPAESSSDTTVKIGASLPLTGGLGSLGPVIEDGYKAAVEKVNNDGGLTIDGKKQKVELIVRDSESDPTLVSDQSRKLVLDDNVTALLGSVSPPLTIPASIVADTEKIPFITSQTPINAWLEGNPEGWSYAWDVFFDEDDMTSANYKVSDLAETNKKVAIFTDTEDDGKVMGKLWEEKAPEYGYEVVSHAEFPVGTTSYNEFIKEAMDKKADVVITQMIVPDAIALWKQMKALGYQPKVAFAEKSGGSAAFGSELGSVSDGALIGHGWVNQGDAETEELINEHGSKYKHADLTSFMLSYSVAKIMLDAVEKAGTTEPEAINKALAETSGKYPVGEVKFADNHTFALPTAFAQWKDGDRYNVYPEGPGVRPLISPVEGLAK